MKFIKSLAFLFSVSLSAFANSGEEKVILKTQTTDAREALIVGVEGEAGTVGVDGDVGYYKPRAIIDGKSYQISNSSAYELIHAICKPFKNEYPHVYQGADIKGWFKKVVFVGPDLKVRLADDYEDGVVIRSFVCMKQPY